MAQNVYGIIYKATNKLNNKVYIGQTTKSLKHRKKTHATNATYHGKMNHNLNYFQKALNKYEKEGFIWEKIDEVFDVNEDSTNQNWLNEKEIFYIQKYKSIDSQFGYNLTTGGSNGKHSEATKKKMSRSQKGHKVSEEARKNMSEAKIGVKLSEEHKRKLSELNKDKILTTEHKLKISESLKGHTQSTETLEKMSKNQNNIISVMCLNTSEKYHSAGEASRKVYGSTSRYGGILKSCRRGTPFLGLQWAIVEETDIVLRKEIA